MCNCDENRQEVRGVAIVVYPYNCVPSCLGQSSFLDSYSHQIHLAMSLPLLFSV